MQSHREVLAVLGTAARYTGSGSCTGGGLPGSCNGKVLSGGSMGLGLPGSAGGGATGGTGGVAGFGILASFRFQFRQASGKAPSDKGAISHTHRLGPGQASRQNFFQDLSLLILTRQTILFERRATLRKGHQKRSSRCKKIRLTRTSCETVCSHARSLSNGKSAKENPTCRASGFWQSGGLDLPTIGHRDQPKERSKQ